MLKTALTFLCAFMMLLSLSAEAKKTRLTDNPLYGITTTSPEAFLGYPLGEHLLRHDQVNYYLKEIAKQNPRVSLENTGQSHEGRQQLTAVITSAKNQQQLDEILKQRQQVKYHTKQTGPIVIWLAYSIHGDEASGAHAALKLSHMLATSEEKWVTNLLKNAVVLITPSQNPDGMDRFSTWANGYAGKVAVSDPNHKEHKQRWPSGRTNHYLADLNRDWLFLRHPESQGRVALFHRWQPHYVGDFHEMGHNQTYFFQPGVPERTHPLTPVANQTLTSKLAGYHQAALDDKKQSYFSRQLFDDFFYGKGSTYPDINGAIGVLFEQASARGQQQDSVNGIVRFQEAIDNQYATSISSLKGALALKTELQEYQADFFSGKHQQSKKKKPRQAGRLISAANDSWRIKQLTELLAQHQIEYYYLTNTLTQGGKTFTVENSVFIPDHQAQATLLTALFDNRTEFEDPTFYDVSTWNLQYAFDLTIRQNVKLELSVLSKTAPTFTPSKWTQKAVALLIDWRQSQAAPALQQLLSQGVQVKFAAKPFTLASKPGQVDFPAGTLQIPLKQDGYSASDLSKLVSKLAQEFRISVTAAYTSGAVSGIDLGSPDFNVIRPIRPLIVSGKGTSIPEVGQIWYYLDSQLKVPTTLVDTSELNSIKLTDYTHIIFAGGSYASLDEKFSRKLGPFTANGGVVIAQKGALTWLSKANFLKTSLRGKRFYKQLFNADGLAFDQKSSFSATQEIGGAIVELTLDKSHPINFGINGDRLPVMKNKALGFAHTSNDFSVAASYASQPLLSGYMAQEYQSSFANTPAIIVESRSKGAVVAIADNLLFRNIWLGSEKLYANALYFIPALH
ncbi:peptidase M14 [Shewanella sp. Choline-02u-19]|uniref:M14 family zinc carboxypeptidase n=1 Tax=unclassified Shewanella TaxID=196818 RepID=UPI000C348063|nr:MULTISPECIES: M14 family zinc carboxypeptidase [unclassified Shewanella]PKH57233.1 peptidase M14 [Shewanella sp. Bg11-22]PKI29653.1 peptidase M14 [Shewanella sp. Choline-02u-19]